MNAVIYARYSSDRQREESIEGQLRECTEYAIGEVPTWIDRVYSADLLVSYYNYYGTLKHGFFNSVFSILIYSSNTSSDYPLPLLYFECCPHYT